MPQSILGSIAGGAASALVGGLFGGGGGSSGGGGSVTAPVIQNPFNTMTINTPKFRLSGGTLSRTGGIGFDSLTGRFTGGQAQFGSGFLADLLKQISALPIGGGSGSGGFGGGSGSGGFGGGVPAGSSAGSESSARSTFVSGMISQGVRPEIAELRAKEMEARGISFQSALSQQSVGKLAGTLVPAIGGGRDIAQQEQSRQNAIEQMTQLLSGAGVGGGGGLTAAQKQQLLDTVNQMIAQGGQGSLNDPIVQILNQLQGAAEGVGGLRSQLGPLRTGLQGLQSGLQGLRDELRPGFGRLTEARLKQIRDAQHESVGGLREALGRRGVLGSSFANDAIQRSNLAFAQESEKAAAESVIQETEMQRALIADQTANFGAQLGLTLANPVDTIHTVSHFARGIQRGSHAGALRCFPGKLAHRALRRSKFCDCIRPARDC